MMTILSAACAGGPTAEFHGTAPWRISTTCRSDQWIFWAFETYSNEELYLSKKKIRRKHEPLSMQVLLLRTEKNCQQTLVKIGTAWF